LPCADVPKTTPPETDVRETIVNEFEVLMPRPLMPQIAEGLSAHFRLHKLWEAPDPDALIAEVGPKVRGFACGGIAWNPVTADLMSRFPKLEIVSNFGVGYDQVDAAWAGAHDIIVTNTPDVLTDEVADLAFGLLLATVRRLPQADRYLREGHWPAAPFPLTASLRGRTIGILGLGRIGKAIARRAEAFGLSVLYHGRRAQADVPYRYVPSVTALAAESDILMIVAPGTPDTQGLVDADVLRALGPRGILVNVARGSLVDEAALIKALTGGTIHSAGLDVFASEPHVPSALTDLENVVLLPHVGSGSHETRAAMVQLVIDNLVHWADGRGALTPVTETPWPRTK
jgi:lactate dehydrogenase-like 2-hydroxyacid dehydrogenase